MDQTDSVLLRDAETPAAAASASRAANDGVVGVATLEEAYRIKPSLEEKFREGPVKEIVREVVGIVLAGKAYDEAKAKKWTVAIANEVNERVKELKMKRYKHVVQVVLGELKGAGVKSGAKCVWDSDTDSFTSEIFMNDTVFCVTTVFAVFLY